MTTLRRGWDINTCVVPRVWCTLERTPVRRKDPAAARTRARAGVPAARGLDQTVRTLRTRRPLVLFVLLTLLAWCSPPAPVTTSAAHAPAAPRSTSTTTTAPPTSTAPPCLPPPPPRAVHRSPARGPGSRTATSSSGASRPRTSRPTSTSWRRPARGGCGWASAGGTSSAAPASTTGDRTDRLVLGARRRGLSVVAVVTLRAQLGLGARLPPVRVRAERPGAVRELRARRRAAVRAARRAPLGDLERAEPRAVLGAASRPGRVHGPAAAHVARDLLRRPER